MAGAKTKKSGGGARSKTGLKNRYYVGSKISEHKFLRILRGFADDIPIEALEATTHLTGQTIRTSYRLLRAELVWHVKKYPDELGSVGKLVFDGLDFRPQGREFLLDLYRSPYFLQHRRRHGQRLHCELQKEHFLLEAAVRLFCTVDLRTLDLEDELTKNLVLLQLSNALHSISTWREMKEIHTHIAGARSHYHPLDRFFEEYRRSLLKHPL